MPNVKVFGPPQKFSPKDFLQRRYLGCQNLPWIMLKNVDDISIDFGWQELQDSMDFSNFQCLFIRCKIVFAFREGFSEFLRPFGTYSIQLQSLLVKL